MTAVGAARWLGLQWPVGTLLVNVVGSFLLGALLQLFLVIDSGSPGIRLAVTTGMMGGFTTYSTFNYELLDMLQSGRMSLAFMYLGATVLGCLLAGTIGIVFVRWMTS